LSGPNKQTSIELCQIIDCLFALRLKFLNKIEGPFVSRKQYLWDWKAICVPQTKFFSMRNSIYSYYKCIHFDIIGTRKSKMTADNQETFTTHPVFSIEDYMTIQPYIDIYMKRKWSHGSLAWTQDASLYALRRMNYLLIYWFAYVIQTIYIY